MSAVASLLVLMPQYRHAPLLVDSNCLCAVGTDLLQHTCFIVFGLLTEIHTKNVVTFQFPIVMVCQIWRFLSLKTFPEAGSKEGSLLF